MRLVVAASIAHADEVLLPCVGSSGGVRAAQTEHLPWAGVRAWPVEPRWRSALAVWVEQLAEEGGEFVGQLERALVEQIEQDGNVARVDAEVSSQTCRGCRHLGDGSGTDHAR